MPKQLFIILLCSSLYSCGGGNEVDNSIPPTPAPAPITISGPDLTLPKLLSDQEMITDQLQPEPEVVANYKSWVNDNSYPIRSVVYDKDFTDLDFLASSLQGKRLVQLGESSHGSKEFNHLKVRLIKYLHQHLGFNVIAFESSFFATNYANSRVESAQAESVMRSIFSVWHTEEVLELFSYIKHTRTTSNPLVLTGFDIQSSGAQDHFLLDEYEKYFRPISDTFTDSLVENESLITDLLGQFSRSQCAIQGTNNSCPSLTDRLITAMDSQDLLYQEAIDLTSHYSDDSHEKFLTQNIKSRAAYIDQNVTSFSNGFTAGGNTRDLGMFDNLSYLLTHKYPTQKAIVWAHNSHIKYQQSNTLSLDGVSENDIPMGQHLLQRFGNDLFSIGLYMIRGASALNDGSAQRVTTLQKNSLEAISYYARKAAMFIPINRFGTINENNQFLYQYTPYKVWGAWDMQQVFSDQFDGVIVIDSSSLPRYR